MTLATQPVAVEGRYVQANGIDIYYTEAGTGTPLILLHAGVVSTNPIWNDTPLSYGSHVADLARHFRVITPDTRGCGKTRHTAGTISFALLADDVAALIDALGLERPCVAGFSEGGTTATILGIRHPDAVRAIVNHAGYDYMDPQSRSIAIMRQMLGGSPDAQRSDPEAMERFFFAASPQMGSMFELMKSDQDGAQGDGYWRTYVDLAFARTTTWPGYAFEDLRKIAVPTLVMAGDRDEFCSCEDGVTTYRSLRAGELAILPNSGHAITPQSVRIMQEFLTRKNGER
jgi:pimeloyl-ACP methyl ester carboxylesterase